jgi:FKBP-type peptidyl-prolyl cis-trans isomerase FkpA
MQLPLRHQATRIHKEFNFNDLILVQLCAFVPWRQKRYFLEWTQYLNLAVLIFIIFFISCKNSVQEIPYDSSAARLKKKEALIKLNKYVVRRNSDLIERFVERTEPEMKKTGTGLWYHIYTSGKGKPVTKGKTIEYSYSIKILDGTICDSVSLSNPKRIKVGQGGIESGLEEAFLLLSEGDHARFIIPPHLAYGNFGNGVNIPRGAIIIYDVILIKVHN